MRQIDLVPPVVPPSARPRDLDLLGLPGGPAGRAGRGDRESLEGARSTVSKRAWVGVVSHAHVMRGSAGGFAQLCHGKRHALARMNPGDVLVYYSPSSQMGTTDGLRSFTAFGEVVGEECYPFDMGGGFVPFRRDISYLATTRVVPVRELASRLHFIQQNPSWGMLARRGQFEIDLHDAELIRAAMLAP